ncbi:hypothetical protein HYH02_005765 [Chlamydomonas schloesseri]|uniref:Uncharacterized protein n=1 Tax=Chlamydomonas schloesseri TaxID=2026947 RepID=A0A835WL24_9CHLO|nr:hypothetical protein HYH02_005765 [Chlamydomonas schloesseri]|eukprot:KAG2449011.1 hypothetical protein HYH02_005765 [Chlamydomonas schloesseri]
MASVKEKIGILGRPASASVANRGGVASTSASTLENTAAHGTKAERAAAALTLWDKWAGEALGPISADPTHEELTRKSRRVQRLEQECAAIAARAQRRLELSAAIRTQPIMLSSSSARGADAGNPALLKTGSFNREMQYAVRERRRATAYAAVKAEGEAEADALAGVVTVGVASPTVVAPGGVDPAFARGASFKSRNMLDALIASRSAAGSGGGGVFNSPGSPKMGGRPRPQSAVPMRGGGPTAAGSGAGAASFRAARPRSAVPGAAGAPDRAVSRQASMSGGTATGLQRSGSMAARAAGLVSGPVTYPASVVSGPGGAGAASIGSGLVSLPEGDYLALRQEVEAVSERLAATQAALEVQTDTEAQLREAIDLMRARLHSSGVREVEAQRRLAQHSKLEPLFDRLAECFTFSNPEEVVARLEFLEDDKLGTFDQLLRTQEEVTRLQQRLAEVQKAGETVATRLTTEHLQGSARLQEQNEQLRQELESMEGLVHRLTNRQAQLVALQTAVLHLWSKLSDDPQFAAAFSGPGIPDAARVASPTSPNPRGRGASAKSPARGGAGASVTSGGTGGAGGYHDDAASVASGGAGIELSDPLSMLAMIEEFVTAKSDKLAIKHFTEIQRVANHVWHQHFRNRDDIRGKVVPTFEQLSKIADKMADKVRNVQDQAGRSQDAEKQLMKQLKRLQQQKRQLEGELARRDELVKSLMGVPRRERPASATAELGRIMRQDATAASLASPSQAAGLGYGPGVSGLQSVASGLGRGGRGGVMGPDEPASPASSNPVLARIATQRMAQQQQQQQQQQRLQQQPSQAQGQSRARPVSAPQGAQAVAAARARNAAAALAGQHQQPPVTSGGTLATLLSPGVASQVPNVTSDLPAGAHWQKYTATMQPPAGGLFYASGTVETALASGGSTGGAGPAGETAPAPSMRWAAPQRSAIEQAFMTRLERRTRVT